MLHRVAPGTEVDDATTGQQKEVIKAICDVAAGLMDGAHDLRPDHACKSITIMMSKL